MRRHRLVPAVAACAAVATALLAAPAAQADSPNWHKTLSDFALAPFNLAVNHNNVYVADGFTNTIGIVGQAPLVVADNLEGGDVAGIDLTADGKTLAWTWSNGDHTDTGLTIRTRGKADVVAHIAAVESAQNPDGGNTYGVLDYGAGADAEKNACVDGILAALTGGPATYTGIVDSHPYSVARVGSRWVVADAGSNVLWSVTDKGAVSTLAVLPPQPITISAEMAGALGADCLAGITYAFEPVPTDVEVGPDGSLWVSTLPGGPEDPSLGARGAVYKVNASTGATTRVAGGFLGATNLAVAPDGTVYVAELFGGQISKIARNGAISTAAQVPGALSVEVHGGYLYVGQMADFDFETGDLNGPGSIVRLKR
jgi:hypothetical protein